MNKEFEDHILSLFITNHTLSLLLWGGEEAKSIREEYMRKGRVYPVDYAYKETNTMYQEKSDTEKQREIEYAKIHERLNILEREQFDTQWEEHCNNVTAHNTKLDALIANIYKSIPWWRRGKIASSTTDLYHTLLSFYFRGEELRNREAELRKRGIKKGWGYHINGVSGFGNKIK